MAAKTTKTTKKLGTGEKKKPTLPPKKAMRREVKDSILAVVFFAITLLLVLSVYINVLGPFGVGISSLLKWLFGFTRWLMPVLTLILGINLVRPKHNVSTKAKLITGLTLTVSISAISYLFVESKFFVFKDFLKAIGQMPNRAGGLLGGIIAFPLICFITKIGLVIIALTALVISALMFFDITLYQAWLRIRRIDPDAPIDAEFVEEPPVKKVKNRKIDVFVDDEPTPVTEEDAPPPEPQPEIIVDGDDIEIKPFSSIPVFVHDDISPDEYIKPADLVALADPDGVKDEDIPFEIKTDGIKTKKRTRKVADPEQQSLYIFPPRNLLKTPKSGGGISREEILNTEKKLIQTLADFGIDATTVGASVGPIVTRYEIAPSKGVRVSKITSLSDDIALSLAATSIRIEAPIPGKAAVGIEVPNKNKSTVYIKELLDSEEFINAKNPLTVALGKDISGKLIFGDLSDMPHLLVAGATGSGKSVCINTILISLLYKASPDEVKLILIDPKVVELEVYNKIPHLIVPVVSNPKKAAGALQWAVNEMERRYSMFSAVGARNIKNYNEEVSKTGEYEKMPQIVVVVDELADLMMVCAKEVEDYIVRLCQKARAAGIYLIIATQRPSVNVVTGLIKANVPSRIAFAVTSLVDSRVILDSSGAEKLLGKGDMLFKGRTMGSPLRIQCCFVSDEEVESVVNHIIEYSGTANYDESASDAINNYSTDGKSDGGVPDGDGPSDDLDAMFWEAVKFVIETGKASASNLQRHFRLGYARAGRIIDDMEKMNIIGPYEGAKPRQVIMTMAEYQEMVVKKSE